mgnify:CR=1 FL=1
MNIFYFKILIIFFVFSERGEEFSTWQEAEVNLSGNKYKCYYAALAMILNTPPPEMFLYLPDLK